MKLNNRGWGLSVFLGFTVVILICVIVAGMNAYKLGLTKESKDHYFDSEVPVASPTPSPTITPTPDVTVTPTNTPVPTPTVTAMPSSISTKVNITDLRQDAIQAAGIYKNMHRKSMTEGEIFTISFKQLMAYGYMKSIEGCSGYVQVSVVQRNIQYVPYLYCSTYISNGYSEEFDEK